MPLLFWKTIQEAKAMGAQEFDLGRSELDNPGLVDFKEHLGATGSRLVYLRIERHLSRPTANDWKVRFLRKAVSHMPNPFLKLAGNLFYRYIG
jgi:CelD/BcsL family acetyltransferase involved in cellulose biosynthesis